MDENRQCTICFQSHPLFVLDSIGFSSIEFFPLFFLHYHTQFCKLTTEKKNGITIMAQYMNEKKSIKYKQQCNTVGQPFSQDVQVHNTHAIRTLHQEYWWW